MARGSEIELAGLRLGERDQLRSCECAGTDGLTTRMLACVPISVTGMKSLCGS